MTGKALIGYPRLLQTLRQEAGLLADAARGTRPDARVPSCPGLTIGETVRHVGSVYRMVTSWLQDGRRPGEWEREPAPGMSLEEYLRTGFTALDAELSARGPDAQAGTWWPEDQTLGFWWRRMAHETTVHRTDVQSAAGSDVADVADDIALDGIDEVLTLWFEHRLAVLGVSGTREGTVGVGAGGRSWLARAGASGTRAGRVAEEELTSADARVSGTPMQVYLWLWGRVGTGVLATEGDDDAVAQLWALLRLATR